MRECPKCGIEHKSGLVTCQKCGNALEDTYLWCMGLTSAPMLKYVVLAVTFLPAFLWRTRSYWQLWVVCGLFIAAQWSFPIMDWWRAWNKENSYYSHGPLVPLIALFLVAINHKRISALKVDPSWHGLVLVLPSIPLFVFGRWTGSGIICALTFITFLVGMMILLLGARTVWWRGLWWCLASAVVMGAGMQLGLSNHLGFLCAAIGGAGLLVSAFAVLAGAGISRLLLFPALYLLFMVPAPSTVLDKVTLPVQMWSTTLASHTLNLTSYVIGDEWNIRQQGTIITSSRLPVAAGEDIGKLRVAGECSGFRMLISLLTFTAFFVYMLRASAWKKAFLVVLSFPLSVFVNGLRITVIGYVGIATDSLDAMMNFHNSWAMVFELVLSFAILFGIARLIGAADIGVPETKTDPSAAAMADETPAFRSIGRGMRGPVAALLFCLLILSNLGIRPLESSARGKLVRDNFPRSFDTWASQELRADKVTMQELKTGDILQRGYLNTADDTQIAAVFIEAARDTDAFHDPHSCLPGGGNSIDEDKIITITFRQPKPFTVRATYLRSSSSMTSDDDYLMVYWYATGSETYPSTSQVRLKMRQAQTQDIIGIAKSWIGIGNGREIERRMAQRQTYLYRFECPAGYEDTDVALERLLTFVRGFVANSKQFK